MTDINLIDQHVAETAELLKALIFIEQSSSAEEFEGLRGSIAAMLWKALDGLRGADVEIMRSARATAAGRLQ